MPAAFGKAKKDIPFCGTVTLTVLISNPIHVSMHTCTLHPCFLSFCLATYRLRGNDSGSEKSTDSEILMLGGLDMFVFYTRKRIWRQMWTWVLIGCYEYDIISAAAELNNII